MNKAYKTVLWIGLFVLPLSLLRAQQFGGFPNRIVFNQIHTDTVQVIYPKGMEYWAQRVANLAHYLSANPDSGMWVEPIKTTIILRNQTVFSNGFVAFAPYRSELVTIPPLRQYSGITDWTDLLTVHEYRHVQQFSKLMKHQKWRPEYVLFGEVGFAVSSYLIWPDWFFEGDATRFETLKTHSGRGRIPEFYHEFAALRFHGKSYSYEKARAGSFWDPVPDHYVLGYHLTSFFEQSYQASLINTIATESWKKYALFSRKLKKYTGKTNKQWYRLLMQRFDDLNAERKKNNDTVIRTIQEKDVVEYQLPKSVDKKWLYVKTSFREPPAFYTYFNGVEKKIHTPGIWANGGWYDVHNSTIIWAEYVPGLQWQNETYQGIRMFDMALGKQAWVGDPFQRFGHPKWSDDGKCIAAIQWEESGTQSLVQMELNGEIKHEISKGFDCFFSAIVQHNEKGILVVENHRETARFVRYNWHNSSKQNIGPVFKGVVRNPVQFDRWIYFSTPIDSTEQIVRLSIESQELEVLTEVPFLAKDPHINNDSLVYVSWEGAGYSIRKKAIVPVKSWIPQQPPIAYYPKLDAEYSSVIQQLPAKVYSASEFKKLSKPFGLHSWFPWVLEPNFGITLFAQNKIGTTRSDLSYVYNINEGASQFQLDIVFAQWYPKLGIIAAKTLNRFSNTDAISENTEFFSGRSWDESEVGFSVLFPLYLTRGRWLRSASIQTSINYLNAQYSKVSSTLGDLSFGYVGGRFLWNNLHLVATRQLVPRWGQVLQINALQSLDQEIATQLYGIATLYFPGLAKTHGLYFSPSYKYEPLKQYYFLDTYPRTFGYRSLIAEHSFRLLSRYSFPILYPDIGIPGTVFFKRLYGTAFFDAMHLNQIPTGPDSFREEVLQRSFGLDLNVDLVIFRILPIRIGLRTVYRLDTHANEDPLRFEFLLYTISF
jgi:hypothetical protein